MIILWDLSSMSKVEEYFVLIYSIGLPFISLILNALLQWRFLIFSHGLLNPCPEMYDLFTSHHDKHLSTATVNATCFMTWFTIHFSLPFNTLISSLPWYITVRFSFVWISCALFSFKHYNNTLETQRLRRQSSKMIHTGGGRVYYVAHLETELHRSDKDQWRERVFPDFCSREIYKTSCHLSQVLKIRRASQIW